MYIAGQGIEAVSKESSYAVISNPPEAVRNLLRSLSLVEMTVKKTGYRKKLNALKICGGGQK